MKKLSLILLAVIFISGCELYSGEPNNIVLVGKWEWLQSTGGIGGITYTPATTGYTRTLIINEDKSFKLLRSGKVQYSGRYDLKKDRGGVMIQYNIPQDIFIPDQFVTFRSADTLVLRDECLDCFSSTYKKVR